MDYVLKNTAPAPSQNWSNSPFYTSSLVLAIDVGMEGIGIALRKGPEILFAQTFLIGDTTRTLEERRAKRAWRRARASRKKREGMLKAWLIRHQILSKERIAAIWHDPSVFQDALKHRLRGVEKQLGSPEALTACLRHGIQHRGFDYHLSGDSTYPWGDDLDFSKIKQWGSHGCCSEETARLWKFSLDESDFSDNEEKRQTIESILDDAVKRYKEEPLESLLRRHFQEEKHPNLRSPFRGPGNHFPRELIKRHLRRICKNSRAFFARTDFDLAVTELIGPMELENSIQDGKNGCIIDYHRRTREEAKELWERKTKKCPYAPYFGLKKTDGSVLRCSLNGEPEIRRFKLLQFLAERTFVLSDGIKHPVSPTLYEKFKHLLENDITALDKKTTRIKPDKNEIKKWLADSVSSPETGGRKTKPLCLAKSNDHNKAFLDQLTDLLHPRRSELERRASISAPAASRLMESAMPEGGVFDPEIIKSAWKESYYLWRMEARGGGPVFPHTVFLFGHPNQREDTSRRSNDLPGAQHGHYKGREHPGRRKDGSVQEHGVIRRLFAGQLKDPHGRRIELSDKLNGATCPNAIIIETIGDIPRGRGQKKQIEEQQKANRKRREELAEKYGFGDRPKRSDLLRAVLYEQQIPEGEEAALCPVTGQHLAGGPLDPALQVAHIYPDSKGGIYERLNLFLTTGQVNAAMGKRIPFECADRTEVGVSFLPWKEMENLALRRLRWGKAKRELFCRKESTIPEWENLTRMSQLARQLKIEAEHWLGLDRISDPSERIHQTTSRVGTPTGTLTAACRRAWKQQLPEFMRGDKSRSNLRHHLYDALVLSHIPPGTGLNFTACDGIFFTTKDNSEREVLSALPGLMPDLQPFEQAHAGSCLVHKHRQKHSKQSRTEQTIYSKSFGSEGSDSVKLRVRKPLLVQKQGKEDFEPAKGVENWLRHAGIPINKLPPKMIDAWKESDGSKPLRLTDKTPVHSVPVETNKEQWTTLVPHRNGRKEIIGYKTATEAYDSCIVFAGPKRNKLGAIILDPSGQPEEDFYAILIPSARNLKAYQLRTGSPWKTSDSPPEDFRPLGKFKKGDLIHIGLTQDKDIAEAQSQTHLCLWYGVTSIKSNGQLEFKLAEWKPRKLPKEEDVRSGKVKALTPEESFFSAVEMKTPGSPKVLAFLLRQNPHLLVESVPKH
jgi:hypothetical protein